MVQREAMQRCWACQPANGFRALGKVPKMHNGSLVFRRGLQDVTISRTGKPIMRIQGGRFVLRKSMSRLQTHTSVSGHHLEVMQTVLLFPTSAKNYFRPYGNSIWGYGFSRSLYCPSIRCAIGHQQESGACANKGKLHEGAPSLYPSGKRWPSGT